MNDSRASPSCAVEVRCRELTQDSSLGTRSVTVLILDWNLALERHRERDKFALSEFDNGDGNNLRLLTKYELIVVGARSLALLARIAVLRRENVVTLVTAFDRQTQQSILLFGVLCHGVHVSGDCQTNKHGRIPLSAIVWERILGTASEVDAAAVVTRIE